MASSGRKSPDKQEAVLDIEEVTTKIKYHMKRARTEEDVKIAIESILGNVAEKFGLNPALYEYTFLSGGRADALYGQVIIEYEAPDSLRSKPKFEHSIKQLKEYIGKHVKSPENFHKHLGISIDGQNIVFVNYNSRHNDWVVRGPFPINVETIGRLLEAIRGLKRKPLDVEMMLLDFGPQSEVARRAVQNLYNTKMQNNRSRVLYEDWRRVFKQVTGYSPEKAKGLENVYEITGKVDYERLLFSVHTYYAFLMKLIAAEIVVLYGGGKFVRSHVNELLEAQFSGKLKDKLRDIEEGTIFRRSLHLENFIEADYFSWYIDEWNEGLSKDLGAVIKSLSDYEVGTADLEPDTVRDLFKHLYQKLMPMSIRHDMGEYYTPDWLAEIVLDEVGFTLSNFERFRASNQADEHPALKLRLLDPACGSGTFLILAIKRLKEYANQHYVEASLLVQQILRNVVGFDLNPLAVIAARTNYLLALGDLLRFVTTRVELPIFLTDSIMVERRSTLTGDSYILRTTVGEFQFPTTLVTKSLLTNALDTVSKYVSLGYSPKEFEAILEDEVTGLDENETSAITELFRRFRILEKEGKNHIWTGVIKNSFAPFFWGKFDYVVGNPPWINWESLPDNYREITQSLWVDYGLIKGSTMGKFKKDIAMLFVTLSNKRYLDDDGTLGFLVPFTLIKTQAGAGYRNFLANKCNIVKVHDMVDLAPFENATNRTSLLVSKKGETEFPIECTSWSKTGNGELGNNLSYEEIFEHTKQKAMVLEPIQGRNKPESPWMIIDHRLVGVVKKIQGSSQYQAYSGVDTGLNSAFWIEVISKDKSGVLIRNLFDVGKTRLEKVESIVEEKAIFPLIRGRDVRKWSGSPEGNILLLHDPVSGKPLPEADAKKSYPRAYAYFLNFKEQLLKRSTHRMMGRNNQPFYSAYKIREYTFAPYKVVWKHVAGKVSGKGEFSAAVVEKHDDKILGLKPMIPDHSLMLIPFTSRDEAYFVCGILNLSIVRLVVAGYTIETEIPTNIPQYVRIPQFDQSNGLHIKVVALCRMAHEAAAKNDDRTLSKAQQELDELSAEIYGFEKSQLPIIQESLEQIHE